jgi:hypothetical protein
LIVLRGNHPHSSQLDSEEDDGGGYIGWCAEWVIDATLSALNPGWIASMGHAAPEASGPML